MSEEFIKFFRDLKDSEDYFLFLRLYHNPSNVLGNKQDMDEAEEEYYKLLDYCRLMMNNNLTKFTELALRDKEFSKKADLQTWRKLNFFLYDSIDFKKYYHMLDDPLLMPLFKKKITVNEYLEKSDKDNLKIALMTKYEIYKKYYKLFKYKYPQEQVDNYDEKKAKEIRDWVVLRGDVIKEHTIKKQEDKEMALKWIERDDYSKGKKYNNTYLYRYNVLSNYEDPYTFYPEISFKTVDEIVCENRFLDIIEKKLDQDALFGVPLDNALEVILFGIRIKKFQADNLDVLIDRLGVDLIKQFDYHRAEELASRLTLCKKMNSRPTSTIIPFPHR